MIQVQSRSEPSPRQYWTAKLTGLATCGALAAVFIGVCYYLKIHHAAFWLIGLATLIYCGAIFAVATVMGRLSRKAMGLYQSPAAKRYVRRFIIAMCLYAFTLICVIEAFATWMPKGLAAYGLAILPAVPLIGAIIVIGLYLREETDEFERTLQSQAALLAGGAAMAIATVWGFLVEFQLAPNMAMWAIFPLWALMLPPAQILVRRHYR